MHASEMPSAAIEDLEIIEENEQAEAASRLRELVDGLLSTHEEFIHHKEQNKYLSMTKRIVDMNNYVSIYIASRTDLDALPGAANGSMEQTARSVILEETCDGQIKSALIYEFIDGRATRRQEGTDGTPLMEAETVMPDDIEDLEKLLGYHKDQFVA